MTEHLRLPPQAIEAEQAVLGGLMLDPLAFDRIVDMVAQGDFYRRDHQLIFQAIKALRTKRRPVDAVTVWDFLKAKGHEDVTDGGAYLVDLAAFTPSAANITAYAGIVADMAMRRRLIDIGTGIVNDAFLPDGRETLDLIGAAQSKFGGLLDNQPCELEPVQPIMARVFDRLAERGKEGAEVEGLTTGLNDFDDLINSMKGGQLLILAARPKMGKTTLAQNVAEYVALYHGKPVAIFSFEMRPEELGDRMLSSIGDIDADRIRRGTLDDDDWTNANRVIAQLRAAPIYVTRPRSGRVANVCAQARRQHAKTPLGLIVIDYLQLMETNGDNRAQGISDITRALKLLAVELDVPVVLLSQLNRDLEKRDNKRPIPADLRDSGAIEQDADVVVFIYRDEIYNKASRWAGTAELIVALQRNGPPGDCRVLYRGDRFRFENLPAGWEPAPLPTKTEGEGTGRGMRRKPSHKDAAAGAE